MAPELIARHVPVRRRDDEHMFLRGRRRAQARVTPVARPRADEAGGQPTVLRPITHPTMPSTKRTFSTDAGSPSKMTAYATVRVAPMPTQTA